MDATLTDRNVGALDIPANLPHHLSPAPNLFRQDSESSVASSTSSTPAVPRSSSFTRSRRFLTGEGLSAREAIGLIDQPDQENNAATRLSYDAARSVVAGTLSRSPKEAPPPPPNPSAVSFVSRRPPTPPPMPDFSSGSAPATPIRAPVKPKPEPLQAVVEQPVAPASSPSDTLDNPSSAASSAKSDAFAEKKRSPLRPLSPLASRHRNRQSTPNPIGDSPTRSGDPDAKTALSAFFGLFTPRNTRSESREDPSTIEIGPSQRAAPHAKRNAVPLNLADLAAATRRGYMPSKIDENNQPVADTSGYASDDSLSEVAHETVHKGNLVEGRLQKNSNQIPATLQDGERAAVLKTILQRSRPETPTERFDDLSESPAAEPRRRVELFRRFRFIQDDKNSKPENLVQPLGHGAERPRDKPVPLSHVGHMPKTRSDVGDPMITHEDTLSFTSANEDIGTSSEERAHHAPRNMTRPTESVNPVPTGIYKAEKLKLSEAEKNTLPHVESITTSSSSNSKTTSDSPPRERYPPTVAANVVSDTSMPFSQAEMPHLRLGSRSNVSAHAFMDGPAPGAQLSVAARLRKDSHTAFLNTFDEPKVEDIRYGGSGGERDTTPLGPAEEYPKEEGQIRKTTSGLQKRLKEARVALKDKAKKLPRGASFSKLRSNSMKDIRSSNVSKESTKPAAEDEGLHGLDPSPGKTEARWKSLPRARTEKQILSRRSPANPRTSTEQKGSPNRLGEEPSPPKPKAKPAQGTGEASRPKPAQGTGEASRPKPAQGTKAASRPNPAQETKAASRPKPAQEAKAASRPKPARETKAASKAAEDLVKASNVIGPKEHTAPGVPEFVTIKRVIRRVRRDGTEEMVTRKVRVRPESVLPNGDVVIKRTMKRNKDDGTGTETLTVLQVIPRRKNERKVGNEKSGRTETKEGAGGDSKDVDEESPDDVTSMPALSPGKVERGTSEVGLAGAEYDGDAMQFGERSGSLRERRSSSRSKTDMGDEDGRWKRARSFGRVREPQGKSGDHSSNKGRNAADTFVKAHFPRSKSGVAHVVDRDTGGLACAEEEDRKGAWLRKKSLPRVLSFQGRRREEGRRKESSASERSDGSWWRMARRGDA